MWCSEEGSDNIPDFDIESNVQGLIFLKNVYKCMVLGLIFQVLHLEHNLRIYLQRNMMNAPQWQS